MGWKKGDVVVKAKPFAHVLSQQYRGTRCDSCFLSTPNLKRCTACRVLTYCNSSCQKKDWKIHKTECKCLKRVTPKVPTESVRLLLRILIRLQDNPKRDCDCANWRKFTDLQSHADDIIKDKKRSEILAQMTFTLGELAGDSVSLPTGQDLLDVYGKMVINTYSICDGEMQAVGSGLYISPSLLDHRCLPNAVAVFSGTTLIVHCVVDIPSDDPTQVYVSYVDQLAPSSERQTQLEDQYYFTCRCQRCLDTEIDSLMRSGQCPKVNCDGVLLPADDGVYHPCQSCQSAVSDMEYISSIHKTMEESREVLLKLDELKTVGGRVHADEQNPEVRLQLCKDLLRKQSVLSPCNVCRVKTLDRAMDACIDSCRWQQAAKYGEETIKAYMKLHPPNTPTVGIQLMKLGKLQLYLQQLTAAMTSLQQAEAILNVTHGRTHGVYMELIELLDQCADHRRAVLERTEDS